MCSTSSLNVICFGKFNTMIEKDVVGSFGDNMASSVHLGILKYIRMGLLVCGS